MLEASLQEGLALNLMLSEAVESVESEMMTSWMMTLLVAVTSVMADELTWLIR